MKKTEIQKLKTKSETELRKELETTRESFRVLKFDLASGKVKNAKLIRETKKKVARLLTFLNTSHDEK